MSVCPFSQLMLHNLFQRRDAILKVSVMTPKVSNTGDEKIVRTEGGVTLADFGVACRSQSSSSRLTSRFGNSSKVASRQLGKEGILT